MKKRQKEANNNPAPIAPASPAQAAPAEPKVDPNKFLKE